MKIIQSKKIPPANGHYSHCINHNGILYISGQLPVDPKTKLVPISIEDQTDLCLEKLDLILMESGSSKYQVIQVRIYISNIELWGKVNERYALFFQNHKPTRCVVPTKELHYGCLIELEAVAAVNT